MFSALSGNFSNSNGNVEVICWALDVSIDCVHKGESNLAMISSSQFDLDS